MVYALTVTSFTNIVYALTNFVFTNFTNIVYVLTNFTNIVS
jgi:hypothetical protein